MIEIYGIDMGPGPKHPEHGGEEIKYSKEMHYKGGCNHELADKDEEFPSLNDQSTGLTYRQRINPNKKVFP